MQNKTLQNKLYVVGIGSGSYEQMTLEAINTLKNCAVIVGYSVYTALLKEHFPRKIYIETPMTKEQSRVDKAIAYALQGLPTAIVSSGDAGVYGMASLTLESLKGREDIEIEIVAGVTAALSGAATLGAPLGHDFAIISLSDLLTPWQLIEKRLHMASTGDFCICLYNPSSKKRFDYLQKACDILLEHQKGETICGIAKNIGREGQSTKILTLHELREAPCDMFTTIFIGNSQTKIIGGHMVTPRGYDNV